MYTDKYFKHKDSKGIEHEYVGYMVTVVRYSFGYLYFVYGVRMEPFPFGDMFYDCLIGFNTIDKAYEYVDALPELEVAT